MSLIMNLIMIGTGWIILPVLYGVLKMETGNKKATVLGIALPEEERQAPEVLEICGRCRKALKRAAWGTAVFPAVFFWMKSMTFYTMLYMFWIFMMIFVFMIPVAKYGEELKRLKYRKGWGSRNGKGAPEETPPCGQPVRASNRKLLALLCVLSVLPVLWVLISPRQDGEKLSVCLILLSLASIVWILAALMLWMDRQKNEVISRDQEENLEFNRKKKKLRAAAGTWAGVLSVLLVWAAAAGAENDFEPDAGWIPALLLFVVVITVLMLGAEWKIIRMRREMTTWLEGYDSEERCWYFGAMLYYNPEDRHFLVERRVGSGLSMNMASAGGKVAAFLVLLLILFCVAGVPFLVGRDEFTPVGLKVENGTLYAVHTGNEYEIPEDEITSVERLEKLPELTRKNGTGLPNLLKGRFRTEDRENRWLCLNPENHVFLQIGTDDGKVYLFSGRTDGETDEVWRELTKGR